MAQLFSKSFYNSKAWKTARQIKILSCTTDKGVICEICNEPIVESKSIHVHHEKELTPYNINDTAISLAQENLMLSCHDCHNKEHGRFCKGAVIKKKERGIYIVYGAPLSGKATYVKENMSYGDLVIDLDRLFQAMSLQPLYKKPDNLKYNIFAVRNLLLDNIKTRYGSFNSAWIIGGYANKSDRSRLANELGAELIFIESEKEDCYYRLEFCNDERQGHQEEWRGYIDKWFSEYTN